MFVLAFFILQMTGSFFRNNICKLDMLKERVLILQELSVDNVRSLVMTRNAKMAWQRTFEPCEITDPVAQRSICIFFTASSLNISTFKITQSREDCFIKKAPKL